MIHFEYHKKMCSSNRLNTGYLRQVRYKFKLKSYFRCLPSTCASLNLKRIFYLAKYFRLEMCHIVIYVTGGIIKNDDIINTHPFLET